MRRRDEGPAAGRAAAPWTRGALASLWLIGFALLAGALAVRWDALMTNLTAAPQVQRAGAQE